MLYQKHESYKYVLPLKPLGKKKMSQPQKCSFWEEVPKKQKHINLKSKELTSKPVLGDLLNVWKGHL